MVGESVSAPVIVLNGASSSGKTTLVRELQRTLDGPWLDAGLDRFLWMLPPRYLESPLWGDVLGPAVRAGATGHALARGMHEAIAALSRSGCPVVADHVLVEPLWVDHCASLFADLPAYLVKVFCPIDVLEERERERRDRTLGQARAQFDLVHAHTVYDVEVDTSQMSPCECAERIAERIAAGPPEAFAGIARARRSDATGR